MEKQLAMWMQKLEVEMSIEMKLKPEEFGWLSQLFEDATQISPMSLFSEKKTGFNEENKKSMIDQSIIDNEGNLKPDAYNALDVLSKSDAYTRIRITGVDAPVDKIVYFNGNKKSSVDATKDGFIFKYPPLDEETGNILSEFTGTSRFVNVNFKVKLSRASAYVFLLALDLMRQKNLKLLTREDVILGFTSEELLLEQNADHHAFHLVSALNALIGNQSPTAYEIDNAIFDLEKQGLFEQKSGLWILSVGAMDLAMHSLIPEYYFNIIHGKVESEESVVKSECYVALFGIHDLLYIDQDASDIVMESMSGSDLYLILMNALTSSL